MQPTCNKSGKDFTIVGNRKIITVKIVNGGLTVIGNHNRIEVAVNRGKIEIIGNRCRLNIDDNRGEAVIVGNRGVISITRPAAAEGDVKSTGNGCKVNIKGSKQCDFTRRNTSPVPTFGCGLNLGDVIDLRALETLPT